MKKLKNILINIRFGYHNPKYIWACICNYLTSKIGWKYPHPVNGLMIYKWPKIQGWLCSQIPYDSW